MSNVQWFKIVVDIFNDNKIAYTDEMLSTIFRRPVNTIRLALKTF